MRSNSLFLFIVILVISGLISCKKKDGTPPYMKLIGSADTTVLLNSGKFKDPGVYVKDETDFDINAVVEGTVLTDSAGTYTLTYRAIDNAGNESSLSRTVHVGNQLKDIGGTYTATIVNTGTDIYTETITISATRNNFIVFKDFSNYKNSNVNVQVNGNFLKLDWAKTAPNKPNLSSVYFNGTGTKTGDTLRLNYFIEEVDTAGKQFYIGCTGLFIRN